LTINVQNRIRITFAAVLFLGVALSSFVFLNGRSVLKVSEPLLLQQLPALQVISDLQLEVAAQEPMLYEYYATLERDIFRMRFDANDAAIRRDIAVLSGGLVSAQKLNAVRAYGELIGKLANELDEILSVYGKEPVDWDRAREVLIHVSAAGHHVDKELGALAASIRDEVSVAGKHTQKRLDSVVAAVVVFSILIGVIAALIGYYVSAYLAEVGERHKLAMFVENNPNPVLRLSLDGEVLYANPRLLHMLGEVGLKDDQISGLLPEDIGERQRSLLRLKQLSDRFEYESHGLTIDCSLCFLPEHNVFHCYLSDITLRKKAEGRLREQAFHDTSTALPNRHYLREEVAVLRESQTSALLLINFDRFHKVVSNLGPEMVDELLRAVAKRLVQVFPPRSSHPQLYRFEGDTFALLVPTGRNDPLAEQIAERTLGVLSDPFHVEGRSMFLAASVGISFFPAHGRRAPELVHNASMALQAVKQAGGGAFQVYSAEMTAHASERMALEGDLRKAIEGDEFFLQFQPQVALSAGRIIAGEALLRWERKGYGLVSPAQFIPVAEETGLITPIGDWVLAESCRTAVEWQSRNLPPVGVAVNISAQQFQFPGLVERVREILLETGLGPKYLELEMTESSAMSDVEHTVRVLSELKKLGVMLAIDDFGTGFSSMSYLSRFPIDRLKVDQSFVRDLGRDETATAITEAVITLGHSLKLKVIAEGVETEEQLARLRNLGCDEMQGYLFSKPVGAGEFYSVLEQGRRLVSERGEATPLAGRPDLSSVA
jgi:diguanylate cyclase (GGDEF)-like protein